MSNENMDFDNPKLFSNGNVVPDDLSMWWSQSLQVFSYDPKVFDGPQVLEDPKVISNGSMDLDNPKVQKVIPSSLMVLILT